jgi:hypothetical protein
VIGHKARGLCKTATLFKLKDYVTDLSDCGSELFVNLQSILRENQNTQASEMTHLDVSIMLAVVYA